MSFYFICFTLKLLLRISRNKLFLQKNKKERDFWRKNGLLYFVEAEKGSSREREGSLHF